MYSLRVIGIAISLFLIYYVIIVQSRRVPVNGFGTDSCTQVYCPVPTRNGHHRQCVPMRNSVADMYKPEGDLRRCCPVYNCTHEDGKYHTHFEMTSGTFPVNRRLTCRDVACGSDPSSDACKRVPNADVTVKRSMGNVRHCCSPWVCQSKDTNTLFVHYQILSPDFWAIETVFHFDGNYDLINGTTDLDNHDDDVTVPQIGSHDFNNPYDRSHERSHDFSGTDENFDNAHYDDRHYRRHYRRYYNDYNRDFRQGRTYRRRHQNGFRRHGISIPRWW